jgi:hypothetical protein
MKTQLAIEVTWLAMSKYTAPEMDLSLEMRDRSPVSRDRHEDQDDPNEYKARGSPGRIWRSRGAFLVEFETGSSL